MLAATEVFELIILCLMTISSAEEDPYDALAYRIANVIIEEPPRKLVWVGLSESDTDLIVEAMKGVADLDY